jgi:hypothetical protein
LYQYLHNEVSSVEKGIPRVYYSGIEGEFNVMVMDMLGSYNLAGVLFFRIEFGESLRVIE